MHLVYAQKNMHMRRGTLDNGGMRDLEEKNCGIKLFLFSLCTKRILIAL